MSSLTIRGLGDVYIECGSKYFYADNYVGRTVDIKFENIFLRGEASPTKAALAMITLNVADSVELTDVHLEQVNGRGLTIFHIRREVVITNCSYRNIVESALIISEVYGNVTITGLEMWSVASSAVQVYCKYSLYRSHTFSQHQRPQIYHI
jgi:hypothetical protein